MPFGRDGYYMCAMAKADDADVFFNACFNCWEEGHHWRDCERPLRPGLKELKEKIGKDGDRLNVFGGGGDQGGRAPHKGPKGAASATPAKPQK